MPVRYGFTLEDGTALQPNGADMSDAQYAFVRLGEMGIGIPKLDRSTLDEFVRRADLLQRYIGPALTGPEGPVILHRADFETLLPGAWTNWGKVTKTTFDRLMKAEIEAYWKHVDSKK